MDSVNEQVFYSDEHTIVTSAQLILPADADSGVDERVFSLHSVVSINIQDIEVEQPWGCFKGGIFWLFAIIGGLAALCGCGPLLASIVISEDGYGWGMFLVGLGVTSFGGILLFFLFGRIAREPLVMKDYWQIILNIRGQTEPVARCRSVDEEKVRAIAAAIDAARRRGGRNRRRMRGSTDS